MKRTSGSRALGRGLAKVEPTSPNTMVAFAAKAGSTALDGDGVHSPFTASLVRHIATPGLDLRKVFGYIRDEVLKNTGNRQEPFVYGSLGGDDVPLVPARPVVTAELVPDPKANIRRDYELALQVGNRAAWNVFLEHHRDGFYADLAKVQLSKIAAEEARVAATEKARLAAEEKARLAAQGAKRSEQVKAAAVVEATEAARIEAEQKSQVEHAKAALAEQERNKAEANAAREQVTPGAGDRAGNKPVDVAALPQALVTAAKPSPEELSRSIQSELRRVGCFTGSASSEWTAAARQSLMRFNRSVGLALDVKTASRDTLDAIKARSKRVCPLICENGFRADGERCVKIVCRAGSVLNADNECESKRAKPAREAKSRPTEHESSKLCEQGCQDTRAICNKTRGGYFNGCGMEASACVARCK
jgi:hypothetical protein